MDVFDFGDDSCLGKYQSLGGTNGISGQQPLVNDQIPSPTATIYGVYRTWELYCTVKSLW